MTEEYNTLDEVLARLQEVRADQASYAFKEGVYVLQIHGLQEEQPNEYA